MAEAREQASTDLEAARSLVAYLDKSEAPHVDMAAQEIAATNEWDAARHALAQAEASARDPEYQLELAQKRLDEAVRPVMRGAIDAVIDDMRALQAKMVDNCAVLLFLKRFEHWSPVSGGAEHKIESILSELAWCFQNWNAGQLTKDEVVEPWRAVFEALHRDADAALPTDVAPQARKRSA
jgi:hypothetical protein